jgi:hypothetical protein
MFAKIRVENSIDRILAAIHDRWQLGPPRPQRRLVVRHGEREAGLPRQPRIDPLAQRVHVRRGERRLFLRHADFRVVGGDQFNQIGRARVARLDHAGVHDRLARIDRDITLMPVPAVAFDAMGLQNGHDAVSKIKIRVWLCRSRGGRPSTHAKRENDKMPVVISQFHGSEASPRCQTLILSRITLA